MEIQKTSNSQGNLEKEEWNWRNQPAWLQALLQSLSHQDSMVLAQRQKYRSMEQDRKPRDKSMNLWTPYLQQRRQGYTMEKKTTSLTSGAGKTGQPLVKEWNYFYFLFCFLFISFVKFPIDLWICDYNNLYSLCHHSMTCKKRPKVKEEVFDYIEKEKTCGKYAKQKATF